MPLATKADLRPYQVCVPFTKEEWDKMNRYLQQEGLIKGKLFRKIVLQHIEQKEFEQTS